MHLLKFIFLPLFILIHFFTNSQSFNFSHLDSYSGLSHNRVNCILKDSRGFVWFGTSLGLNRYDGKNFKVFYSEPKDKTTIASHDIVRLFEDPKGRIWVNTIAGLNIYDPKTESFSRDPSSTIKEYKIPRPEISRIFEDKSGNYFFVTLSDGLRMYSAKTKSSKAIIHLDNDTSTIHSNNVSDIKEDSSGFYWMIHSDGTIEKLDPNTLKVVLRVKYLNKKLKSLQANYGITIDRDDDLWISVFSYNKGLFYYNPASNTFKHLHEASVDGKLNTNVIRGVVEDNSGNIWIGTDHGGINLLDKSDFSVRYIRHDNQNNRSLRDNSIGYLYKDNTGIIWIGTFKTGVDYYHEKLLNFQLIKHSNPPDDGFNYDDTNCFAEDEKGNLWIGLNEGGLAYLDRAKNIFKYYNSSVGKNKDFPSNIIISLLIDKNKELWIGTYYGGLYNYNGKNFKRYSQNSTNPTGISSDNIWKIFEDSKDNLWIGTLGEGLDLYDRKLNVFQHFRVDHPNSIHSNFISSILEDVDKNLWVGTAFGLDVYDKSANRFLHYINDLNNPKSLINNSIICLLQDRRGFVWVGTKDGLTVFNKKREVIRNFTMKDGLPSNYIVSLLEDANGNIWMGTSNGLSNLIFDYYRSDSLIYMVRNYSERDGLQGRLFNENSAFKTSKGELIFGGPNGFNIFDPGDIKINKDVPKIVFSELQVFNKEIKPNDKVNGRAILEKSILETEELVLKNSENVFSISFAALNYFHPEKNKYSYKLEGFDDNWITADDKVNRITYTNLNPGEYMLKVRASNNDGYWNDNGASLKITILPPFWKTKFAIALYIVVFLLALLFGRKVIIQRANLRFEIAQERKEVMRIHEMDMMKIKFFTNISHEFRTPISLILTPIDKILGEIKSEDQRKHLLMMQRNAKRLMNLVNQLLDFRKIEVQEIKLNPIEDEIISFIKDTCFSFSDVSEKKNIKLFFHSQVIELQTSFDKDKLERIIFNLLSNAFKFTQEGGEISISTNLLKNYNLNQSLKTVLEIRVKDTGIGIPESKKELIFERFFQNETRGSLINQGSGIGLSITKEFVKLHGGTIFLENGVGGSTFVVILPVESESFLITGEEINEEFSALKLNSEETPALLDERKQTLLLVEDNDDFRFYLKDNLKEHFNILEASNGKEGWLIASTQLPDLIVSDIMMAEMSGLQLSKKVRSDMRTSHIPVILLTARSKEVQKIEGYNSGASEYITKPFNYEILLSRIKNLIHERELVKKSFQKNIEITPSEIHITSMDQKLVEKAIKLVEVNISNSDFSVEEMGRELGMSRAHLYKKILALTGKTPIEFIRLIRMKRAAQLLEKSQKTVSEIAYEVGINNLKYFAKYFKAEFNILPSQYAKKFKES